VGAGNPAIAQMARSVIDSLSKRGAPPSQSMGGAGGSQPPDMIKDVLSSRLNELQGADPGAIVRKLQQMKQDVVEMFGHVAFTLPGVTKHLSTIMKGLDGALKEAEQALSTQQSASSVPIGMSALNPTGGDNPPQPGGSPFMPGTMTGS